MFNVLGLISRYSYSTNQSSIYLQRSTISEIKGQDMTDVKDIGTPNLGGKCKLSLPFGFQPLCQGLAIKRQGTMTTVQSGHRTET